MLEQAKLRTLPLVNRSVELAPAAQACCGALPHLRHDEPLTLAGAAAAAATAGIVRVVKRLFPGRSGPLESGVGQSCCLLRVPGNKPAVEHKLHWL